ADADLGRAPRGRGRGGGADRDPLCGGRRAGTDAQEPFPPVPRPAPDHHARGGPGVEARRRGRRVPPLPGAAPGDPRPGRRIRRPALREHGSRTYRMSTQPTPTTDTDVAILGGGLAGLTLAIQLRRQDPALRVTVIERNAHPVREAAFKVGESTVEIGAHYFAHVLGLRDHLDREQVRKFGFRFFFSEGRMDVDRCTELGVSRLLPTPSWQIDRGRFENFLGKRALGLGVDFRDAAIVRAVELGEGDDAHRVTFERDGAQAALSSRWVVDASGRAALLKRKLGLAQDNDHDANAAWWRVEGRIDPNTWSDDPQWLARCTPPDRWRS